MARSTQGFGAGFASGYGLVQQQAENERKGRADERQLDYYDERNRLSRIGEENRNKESSRRLGIDETKAANDTQTIKNQGLNLTNQGLVAKNRKEQLRQSGVTVDKNAELADLNLGIARTKSQRDNKLYEDQQDFRSTNDQTMAMVGTINAAENYFRQSIQDGTYTPDGFKEHLNAMQASLKDNPGALGISLESQFSPVMTGSIEQFQSAIQELAQGGTPSQSAIVDMANLVFRGNNMRGVGELVTREAHSDAYEEMFTDGTYRIVSKRIGGATQSGVDDNNLPVFEVQVDVTAVNSKGQKVVYPANMTENRTGKETGETYLMSSQDLFEAAAGYISWNKHAQQYKNFAQQARIKSDTEFQNDDKTAYSEAKFNLWENSKIAEYKQNSRDKEHHASGVPGMTREQLMADKEKLKDYFLTERYDAASLLPTSDDNEVDGMISDLMESVDIQKLERRKKTPLTRRQVLRSQQFMRINPKTREIEVDPRLKKEWNEYQSDVLERRNNIVPESAIQDGGFIAPNPNFAGGVD